MEGNQDFYGMLDLMIQPGFCVKENMVVKVNAAAEALLLTPGMDIRPLLLTGQEEYEAFEGGCLYLKLSLSPKGCGASVTRMEDLDVFLLEPESGVGELRVLSLAARELREPLTSILISAEHLLPEDPGDEAAIAHSARLNRSLHQLLRIIGNMSDAGRCAVSSPQETRNITELFREIFEKAQTLVAHNEITLTYQGLSGDIYCLADGEQLERAVLNILSNAVKFTPKGGSIQVILTRHKNLLRLSILDSGPGIAETVRSSVFSRFRRQPGIEDGRYGIGLGMVMIRSAAANHGGTVLIDQPEHHGTRITMTIALRQSTDHTLHSPIMRFDYAGERDHGLIELSDCLPVSAYEKEK